MKQIIFVQKNTDISMECMVRASTAFLSHWIFDNTNFGGHVSGFLDDETLEWITGNGTIEVHEVESLENVYDILDKLELIEDEDYFQVDGFCVGLRPLLEEIADKISI